MEQLNFVLTLKQLRLASQDHFNWVDYIICYILYIAHLKYIKKIFYIHYLLFFYLEEM